MADDEYPDEYWEWYDTQTAVHWDAALAQVMDEEPPGEGVDADELLFHFYTEFGGSSSVDIWASPQQISGGYEVPLAVRGWLPWARWYATPAAVHWDEALAQVMDEETPGEGVDADEVLFSFYTEFDGGSSVNIRTSPKHRLVTLAGAVRAWFPCGSVQVPSGPLPLTLYPLPYTL